MLVVCVDGVTVRGGVDAGGACNGVDGVVMVLLCILFAVLLSLLMFLYIYLFFLASQP